MPVETLDEAIAAVRAGANRVELCASLDVGGLTPTEETLAQFTERARVPFVVMIRPRPGDFVYNAEEAEVMEWSIEMAHLYGANGVVFGALQQNGSIDLALCRRLLENCFTPECVFHRAFDCVPDRRTALEQLIEMEFTRILTSGGAACAADATGIEGIARLIEGAAGRIDILPGGGIRPGNVASLVAGTRCRSVHSSCRVQIAGGSRFDPTIAAELRRLIDQWP